MDEQSKTTSERPASNLLGAVILGLGAVVYGFALLHRSQQRAADRKPIGDPQEPTGGDQPQVRRALPNPNEIAWQLLQQHGRGVIDQVAQKAQACESQGEIEEARYWRQIEAAIHNRLAWWGAWRPPLVTDTKPDPRVRNLNNY